MFDKEYSFKGTHAEKVNKLTAKFDDKNQLFKRNLDVYMMAPIVGFLFQLLDKKNAESVDERVDKAFRQFNSPQAENDEKLFDQYVLGGVDILYEKLIESATSTEDYLKNLYDFMEDMDDRYNQTIDSDQISSLCRLAKK